MNLLHKALHAFQHMSDEDRLLWILCVGAALYWLLSTFKRWWRRWRNYRSRKRYEDAVRREPARREEAERRELSARTKEAAGGEKVARKKWEGHPVGHVGARYKRWDDWLKKIGYPKGKKSRQD